MTAANLMRQLVNVERKTTSKGTTGAEQDFITLAYENLPCSIQPITARWLIEYMQRNINTSHTIFVGQLVTLQPGDEIVFGTRRFYVQGVRNLVEIGKVIAVDALERTGAA